MTTATVCYPIDVTIERIIEYYNDATLSKDQWVEWFNTREQWEQEATLSKVANWYFGIGHYYID